MTGGCSSGPAVSVVIPAYRAHDTIGRAIESLLAQTMGDWEAILVCDDGSDYRATLAAAGLDDPRVRHTSSGGVATGCGRARNAALPLVRGAFVTRLDADDAFRPARLERLLPFARTAGAAADDLSLIDEESGATIRRVVDHLAGPTPMSAVDLALLHAPSIPLVARDLAPPWIEDVDIAEDVIHLFAVEDRAGPITVVPEPLYEYRIRAASMCHGPDGAARAEASYAAIERRLEDGGFPDLSPAARVRARAAFAEKRAFNLRFGAALAEGLVRDFQSWCVMAAEIGGTVSARFGAV